MVTFILFIFLPPYPLMQKRHNGYLSSVNIYKTFIRLDNFKIYCRLTQYERKLKTVQDL